MRKIINTMGDVIMAAVVIVIGLAVLAGSGAAAEVPAAAPAAGTAVQESRDHAPSMDAPYYAVMVSDDEQEQATNALRQVDAPADVEYAAYMALLETGARGAMNDDYSAIYAKVGMVVDFGSGTVTVTNSGPAICVDSYGEPTDDGEPFPCTGREFLTAEWQSY